MAGNFGTIFPYTCSFWEGDMRVRKHLSSLRHLGRWLNVWNSERAGRQLLPCWGEGWQVHLERVFPKHLCCSLRINLHNQLLVDSGSVGSWDLKVAGWYGSLPGLEFMHLSVTPQSTLRWQPRGKQLKPALSSCPQESSVWLSLLT
jgi:hypothetical protein